MDSIPQEIIDHISATCFRDQVRMKRLVHFKDLPFKRPLLATISRSWQWAIEKQSFSVLYLKSTELDAFQQIVTGHRRRFLQSLRYTIILPEYSLEACTQFEREADRQINNVAFTTAIYKLFQILHSWGSKSDSGSPYSIRIQIQDIYSPTDYRHRVLKSGASIEYVGAAEAGDGETAHPRDLQGYRYKYSSLHLYQAKNLPVVPAIRHFITNPRGCPRMMDPESAIQIAAKSTKLRWFWLNLHDWIIRYPALRRSNRDAFVQALESLQLPTSIQQIIVSMLPTPLQNQSWHPTHLAHTILGYDLLSSALRKTTVDLPHLIVLRIDGIIDPSLFWPSIPETVIQPFWQHLQCLDITFDLTTPSGEWYFKGDGSANTYPPPLASSPASETQMPPGYGFSVEEDFVAALRFNSIEDNSQSGRYDNIFRTVVNEQLLIPLIEAFAKACIQVPTLETAFLMTSLRQPVEFRGKLHDYPTRWGIYYSAPGQYHDHRSIPNLSYPASSAWQRTLTYEVREWRLSEDLCSLLRCIGQGAHKKEPIERYIDRWASTERQEVMEELAQEYGE